MAVLSSRNSVRSVATPRLRRGATIVMVAIFSVVVVGLAAFAIDVSRLYVGANELQTRADATALNAALLLQRNPATAQLTTAANFAANNEVMGARAVLETGDIEPGVWDPTTRVFTQSAWTGANAVRVTARSTGQLLFGRLISAATSSTPTRRAIAWVANMTGTDCLRPWGISQSLFQTRFGYDLTTQAGINGLRAQLATTTGPGELTVVLSPNVNAGTGGGGTGGGGTGGGGKDKKNESNGGANNTVLEPDDFYQAITGDQNASPESHAALIRGTECGNGMVERATGTMFAQPNSGAAVANEADAIVQQDANGSGPCKKVGTNDATCYDPTAPGNVAGRTIVIPTTVPAAANGQPNQVRIVSLTEFRLMCAFTTDPGGNPLGPSPDSCPWLASVGRPATGYRRGTIVGYPLAGGMDLGNGTQLGNAPSTGQRLILVQ